MAAESSPGVAVREFFVFDCRHFDLDVNPIEERARDLGPVALHLLEGAGAFMLRVAEEPA
jgi:hypothetical protein